MTAVSIHNVSRTYSNGDGLQRTSLQIESGEFVVLLGPSGSGKTTLLRLLAGFEPADSGSITIDGTDVTRLPPEARPTALVFQSHALWPHMSVFDNVAFGLKAQGKSKANIATKVVETLDLVQLDRLASRKPGQLSGGQRQRVALARALAVEPKVLLLDEPLSALDARLRDDLRIELRRIQERLGLTAVYVTHDQDDALALADRVAVLRDGSVLQFGTPREIYERPVNSFVARFCGDSVLLPCRVISTKANGALTCVVGEGNTFTAAGGDPNGTFLSIRPQALTLMPEPAHNSLPAQILRRRYAGGLFRLELETETGARFNVETADEQLVEGSTTYVVASPERLWVVRNDDLAAEATQSTDTNDRARPRNSSHDSV